MTPRRHRFASAHELFARLLVLAFLFYILIIASGG